MAFTVIASAGSSTNSTTYTAAVTIQAARVYLVYWSACSASTDPGAPTISDDSGLALDAFDFASQAYNTVGTPRNRLGSTVFWRAGASELGSPVACTLTFTYGSTLASHCVAVIEADHTWRVRPLVFDNYNATAADTGAPSVTLPSAFVRPLNASVGAFASDDANGTSAIPDFTPDADFTVLAQPSVSDGTASMRLVVLAREVEDLTPNGTWSVASTDWGGLATEVTTAAGIQYLVPGGPYVTEDTEAREFLLPASGYLTEMSVEEEVALFQSAWAQSSNVVLGPGRIG